MRTLIRRVALIFSLLMSTAAPTHAKASDALILTGSMIYQQGETFHDVNPSLDAAITHKLQSYDSTRDFKVFRKRIFDTGLAMERSSAAQLVSAKASLSTITQSIRETARTLEQSLPGPGVASFDDESRNLRPVVSQAEHQRALRLIEARRPLAQSMLKQSRLLLARADIAAQLSTEAQAHLERELNSGELMINTAAAWAQDAAQIDAAKALFDLGYTTVKASYDFMTGLAQGVYQGFYDVSRLAETLVTDITVAERIVNGLMRQFSDNPVRFIGSALEPFIDYVRILSAGTAEQKGRATGELLTQTLIGLLAGGAGATSIQQQALVSAIADSAAGRATGKALDAAIRNAERLAPLVQKAAQGSLNSATLVGLRMMDASIPSFSTRSLVNEAEAAIYLGNKLAQYSDAKFARELAEYGLKEKMNVGKLAIIAEGRDGLSYFIAKERFEEYVVGKGVLGAPDGLYVLPRAAADRLLQEALGTAQVFEKRLGIKPGQWTGREIIRVDLPFDFSMRPRLPSGMERTANEYFRYGGFTLGGMPELVINQLPRDAALAERSIGVLK